MKTTEINNQKLRNQVENLENGDSLQFNFDPKTLIDLGWVFDDCIDYILETNLQFDENSTHEDAEDQFCEESIIYVRIEKQENDEFCTTYEINNMKDHISRISNGISQDTGDDEQTIKDIQGLSEYRTLIINMSSKEVSTFNESKQTHETITFSEASIEGLTEDEIEEKYQDDYNVIFK